MLSTYLLIHVLLRAHVPVSTLALVSSDNCECSGTYERSGLVCDKTLVSAQVLKRAQMLMSL